MRQQQGASGEAELTGGDAVNEIRQDGAQRDGERELPAGEPCAQPLAKRLKAGDQIEWIFDQERGHDRNRRPRGMPFRRAYSKPAALSAVQPASRAARKPPSDCVIGLILALGCVPAAARAQEAPANLARQIAHRETETQAPRAISTPTGRRVFRGTR